MRCCCLIGMLLALALPTSVARADEPSKEDLEFFEKQIRPILSDTCFECHGAEKQKANLRLDSRAALLTGGDSGPAIKPGNPDGSLLIEALNYEGDTQMPPKGKLDAETIDHFKDWIKRGAPWPKSPPPKPERNAKPEFNLAERKARQWVYQPLNVTAPPAVKQEKWCRDPIDRFLLARMEQAGLQPAARADKRTWLRRVTFDLIGLPPTVEEIRDFLADDTDEAHARVVERLLASPHYGERWGRHWLDLVRFAETRGHEFDFEIPHAWQYRDYIIRAFNADLPYDQLVREHIAGDLLASPRRHPTENFNESMIGTGFWFLGEAKHSPVDIRADEAERIDNQLDVLGKTFFAATVACARCHDHKFDAIAAADYYGLAGYLQSSRYQVACVDDDAPRRAVVEELVALRTREQSLRNGARPHDAAYFARLFLAVRDVQSATRSGDSTPAAQTVIADFDGDDYAGWTTTGTAFGGHPNRNPLPNYQGDVAAVGRGFVNSHSYVDAAGARHASDAHLGTLTSPELTLRQPYLRMLIGGGAHIGKTCVNILLDGKVVASITGRNENRMRWDSINLSKFVGQTIRIEIVDQEPGGWGNIGVDQIVACDAIPGEVSAQIISEVAKRHKVNSDELAAWVVAFQSAITSGASSPLAVWAPFLAAQKLETPEQFRAVSELWMTDLTSRVRASQNSDSGLIADFNGDTFGDWSVTGEAFGTQPLAGSDVLPAASRTTGTATGIAHSGAISPRLRGALRSATFEIQGPKLAMRVAGKQAKINLIIDGFQLIQNPIYGGLTRRLEDAPAWQWVEINVEKWVGHRAYLEFLDEGDGWIAIDRVVAGSPTESACVPSELQLESWSRTRSLADVATLFGAELQAATRPDSTAKNAFGIELAGIARECSAAVLTAETKAELDKLEKQAEKIAAGIEYKRFAVAMLDGTGEDEQIFLRGSHKRLGDVVPRRLFVAISGDNQPVPAAGSGRLELADRMLGEGRGILARVMVNRIWKHHFGQGLARTPDDFGNMGQPPTHPELLDTLAHDFVEDGWSIKRLHRRILLSAAYGQSSQPADNIAHTVDPQNLLLSSMPIQRLEAEAVRDAILAVSGRLDHTLYGPSVLPHLTPFMIGRGRPGQTGPLDGGGRRSVYVNVRRNFLTPFFLAFDYPIPFTTIGRRSVSNVPAQALSMLNNPFVIDQAGVWAERIHSTPGDTQSRILRMYEEAFGRLPSPEELQAATAFLSQEVSGAEGGRAAWRDFAHVLLNVKEFIFIN